MEARGPLMVEHRVIEKVVGAMQVQLDAISAGGRVDRPAIDDMVDFLRTYADRTHHGKEEDILFHHLSSRPLTLQHRVWLEELMDEHALSRQTTAELADANAVHRDGDPSSLAVICTSLKALVDLYPAHIAREDDVFFPAALSYLSSHEEHAMLREFREFDERMIHEKYRAVARRLSGGEIQPLGERSSMPDQV